MLLKQAVWVETERVVELLFRGLPASTVDAGKLGYKRGNW